MMETEVMIFRLVLAGLLGGLIGMERERHGRPAGFRTNILLATGSALLMMLSQYMYDLYPGQNSGSIIRLDPGRIAAMSITGIGFLGAGAIIKSKGHVRGLTTAACLWMVAAVGLAVGCGFYLPALVATGIALFSLLGLRFLERHFRKDWYRKLILSFDGIEDQMPDIIKVMDNHQVWILRMGLNQNLKGNETGYELELKMRENIFKHDLISDLARIPGLKRVQLI
ncbi:MAG: MgtC/SapB family protein [Proteobacteria bacterium]|nr:MgtC/SapB family protein [Pseudomonadota bacterium]